MMTLVIMLLALNGVGNTSFAQESGNDANWKSWHFTSEAEYIQHQNGGTRYGGNFHETQPPTGTVRFPAEFEKMQGVIVSYSGKFGLPTSLIAQFTRTTKVYVLVSSGNQSTAESNLQSADAIMSNVVFWNMSVDSYWARDFGPWYIFNDNRPAIVDFVYNRNRQNDDDAPINIANTYQNLPLYGMNLIHTGGNMMQDGRGTGVSDELVYNENYEEGSTYHGFGQSQLNLHYSHEDVDDKMHDYLNIDPYHVTPDPLGQYIAHVDCWGKFLAPDKIIIARMPQNDAHYQDYENVANFFATTNCCYGYPYKVYRVNEISSDADASGSLAPYTNSLILNDKVFVPLGVNTTYNDDALAVYREAMPGYTIVGVECPNNNPWLNSDAIHCRARGMMDFNMMFVDHRNVIYGEGIPYQSYYTVNADLIAYSGANIAEANLVYRTNGTEWKTIPMSFVSGNQYTAVIPGIYGATVDYYVTATDAAGNTGSQPMMGALDPHHFSVEVLGGIHGDFVANVTEQYVGEPVRFYDVSASSSPIVSWSWTFTNGIDYYDSEEMNPVVCFETPGVYDVELTLVNASGVIATVTKEAFITVVDGEITLNMGDKSTIVANHVRFYDSGGPNSNYANKEKYTVTFYPAMEGSMMSINFESFTTENRYDFLYVYDGPAITSTLIGKYSGNTLPASIIATNPSGALTVRFTSDNSTTKAGWAADVDCIINKKYLVEVCDDIVGGVVTCNPSEAEAGQTVTITVTPSGYSELTSLTVEDSEGNPIQVSDANTFVMPENDVTVCATFDVCDYIMMHNDDMTVSRAKFYDTGGEYGNYSNNENMTLTLRPSAASTVLRADFAQLYVENRYDHLYVYDGEDVNAPLIADFTGKYVVNQVVQATNSEGALTFRFTSDYSTTKLGWAADIYSVPVVAHNITYFAENGEITGPTSAYPDNHVVMNITPDEDYMLSSVALYDGDDNLLDIAVEIEDNTASFIMPAYDVQVVASFIFGYYKVGYELVTDYNDLFDADATYIIVNTNVDGEAYAMGEQVISGINTHRLSVPVEVEDDFVVVDEDNLPAEFTFSGTMSKLVITDVNYSNGNGKLFIDRGAVNNKAFTYYLSTTTSSPYRYWTIAMGDNGDVSLRSNTYTSYYMCFDAMNEFFNASTSLTSKVYIYKKVADLVTEDDRNITNVAEQQVETLVYPNPTHDVINVVAAGMNHVSVFNISGQMLYDMDVDADNLQLNMADFGSGMFLVRVVTADGVATQRVVVE